MGGVAGGIAREAKDSRVETAVGLRIRTRIFLRWMRVVRWMRRGDSLAMLEICCFSEFKIYPSRGRTFISADSKTHRFLSSKTESLYHQRKNGRILSWTPHYRRINNKGVVQGAAKKRTRRNVKYNRGVVGASWEAINARRNEKPEVRAEAIAKAKAKAQSKTRTATKA
ncbi:60S ribosomal protein L24 [Coemansia sp. RSA 2702]|nr:60S ribosomal protein L24 [Coemansia sp. RSA 2704]KAJ2326224.1 60S ribosomal protein L24 [Coemansia sp. RSA 2702]KAJ2716870.1 60S ribosomal protein L24 [Coemansia sp. Cherry 401B]